MKKRITAERLYNKDHISFEIFKYCNESQIDVKKTRKSTQNESHKKRH